MPLFSDSAFINKRSKASFKHVMEQEGVPLKEPTDNVIQSKVRIFDASTKKRKQNKVNRKI